MTNAMTVAYPAHRDDKQLRTPIAMMKMVNTPKVDGTLRLLSSKPMKGVEATPPTGRATSKKSLILSALVSDPNMYLY